MKNEPSVALGLFLTAGKLHVWVSSERTGTLGENLLCPAARGIGGIKDQQSMKGCSDYHSPVQGSSPEL